MTDIKNSKDLHAAIAQLQADVQQQEHRIKADFHALKEQFKPANILSNSFEKITGVPILQKKGGIAGGIIKIGLSLLLGKIMVKAEEKLEHQVYDLIDQGFDKLKNFLSTRFQKSPEKEEPPAFENEFND
ncbi:MAG: hypothetical protein NTX08_08690 [Sphingobacteriales bacterium]|nr:hypothetical protein [Sphingobacteriales bacterium]